MTPAGRSIPTCTRTWPWRTSRMTARKGYGKLSRRTRFSSRLTCIPRFTETNGPPKLWAAAEDGEDGALRDAATGQSIAHEIGGIDHASAINGGRRLRRRRGSGEFDGDVHGARGGGFGPARGQGAASRS